GRRRRPADRRPAGPDGMLGRAAALPGRARRLAGGVVGRAGAADRHGLDLRRGPRRLRAGRPRGGTTHRGSGRRAAAPAARGPRQPAPGLGGPRQRRALPVARPGLLPRPAGPVSTARPERAGRPARRGPGLRPVVRRGGNVLLPRGAPLPALEGPARPRLTPCRLTLAYRAEVGM